MRRLRAAVRIALPVWFLMMLSAGPAGAQQPEAQRAKMRVAIGMGLSFDRNPPNPKPDRPLTSIFFAGGFGDGPIGLELRAFSNGASTAQIARQAIEVVFVFRPVALVLEEPTGYGFRILRTVALDAGPAYERAAKGFDASRRKGVVVGGHLELPIGPASFPKEVRLRLGARRILATHSTVGVNRVKDSTAELYGLLGVVF